MSVLSPDSISSISSNEIAPKNKNDYKCAPNAVFKDGSCIPLDVLVELTKGYNNKANKKIKLHNHLDTLNPGKYKRYLIRELDSNLSDVCDSQRCWLKQKFISDMNYELKNKLKKNTFRPKGPSGQFTWLNTHNIDNVMEQYESKYQDFKFMGAVPIDFDDLPQLGIKDLDYSDLKNNGKTKLGFVFNLDEHYKGGSHWVSMFADLTNGKVYFSDSYGIRPEERIRKLMRRVTRYIQDSGIKNPDVQYNELRHQRGGSECGVYSINFILRLLKGETFNELTSKRMTDSEVNDCRDVYFTK